MDDCITIPVTMKVGGNMTIPVARSRILFTQSGNLIAVRSIGISTCVNEVPGGGGGMARREHALIICSSLSTSSLNMGFKAEWKVETYFFTST